MLGRELGRKASAQAHGRNIVARLRPVAGRRQLAFKGVRPSVRVFAEAPAASEPAKLLRLEDIQEGAEYEGTVTAVENFGAFVDIGTSTNGLIHISKLAAGFTKNAKDVVSRGQKVTVKVLNVDAAKKRVSLELTSGGEAAPAAAEEEEVANDIVDVADERADGGDDEEEDEVEVELEEGQVEVYADLPGFQDIPFVMDMDDEGELSEAAVAALEADLDAAEIKYELEGPAYLEEITGKVSRIEDYGLFLDFDWNGKKFTGLLARDEMKVPSSALPEEAQAALRAEWADTEFEMPQFVELADDELDIKKFYQPGDEVPAFVLESKLVDPRGITLTHFTDEDVAAEADLMEGEDEVEGSSPVEDASEYQGYSAEGLEEADTTYETAEMRTGLIKGKNGFQVAPLGLPSRSTEASSGLAILGTSETDFDGDEVQLVEYWNTEMYESIPKDVLKRIGLKMSFNERGEAEFTERPDFEDTEDVPIYLYNGDVEARAREFLEDLLDDDTEEAELPARAARRPIVLAAAVQNISASDVKQLRDKTGAGMMDCKKALTECGGDAEAAAEWLRKKGLSGADKKAGRLAAEGAVARYIHPGSRLGVLLEVNCETDFVAASEKFQALVGELGMIIAATDCICVSPEDVPAELLAKEREVEMGKEDLANKPEAIRAKIVEGRLEKIKNQMALTNQMTLSDPDKTVANLVKETIAAVGENIKIRRFTKYRLGEGLEKKSSDFAAEVAQQTQAKAAAPKPEEPKKEEPKVEAKPAVQVSAGVVKQLRDKTGAGMMDCKKALAECNNDMEKATEWLRMKGLASADKKAGRVAAEGVIASYIHPGSRLGVLLEVNCETDFVAASEKFNELVNYIAMGIVAGQNVQYVSADDIPAEVFEREKQIEMGREDLKNKPEAIRAKIAEGRAKKIAQEMCLLDQPFLTDPSKTVADAIKEAIAAIGEKISVRRFIKYQLGEGLEKKSNDFAAEVAAATGMK
ncbi:hypothetical protein VOLCADRAFT_120525 [Volvox carteri f. nagariensis]|uniref:Elongation factor Ts, mitochondrial n=1 Tax=Volvox carteri f. nagariensis TaxID=3068 RepID=D8TNM0_VOLCA|nr:uncharacterized protein VOLCADRAFT_120525 [Volvox carteri f. nagariensis]EFJ50868.1 hypothetical protein VOLCADRAFT_120525 [Volvox carteri f. nagariensis]|eukprot:XP_002947880.1 hypothetical protein VOLCADRAFT_120525 [Volvox carteri f. nagariensis]